MAQSSFRWGINRVIHYRINSSLTHYTNLLKFTFLFSAVDEYGFERHEDFDFESYEDFMSVYLKVLATRAQKWSNLLGEGKSVKRTNTVKRYVRKGIPSK